MMASLRVRLATGPARREAARSSPFPFFTLYCKLQSAIKCLYYRTEANDGSGSGMHGAWDRGEAKNERSGT